MIYTLYIYIKINNFRIDTFKKNFFLDSYLFKKSVRIMYLYNYVIVVSSASNNTSPKPSVWQKKAAFIFPFIHEISNNIFFIP